MDAVVLVEAVLVLLVELLDPDGLTMLCDLCCWCIM
jgi:hypothetical protein